MDPTEGPETQGLEAAVPGPHHAHCLASLLESNVSEMGPHGNLFLHPLSQSLSKPGPLDLLCRRSLVPASRAAPAVAEEGSGPHCWLGPVWCPRLLRERPPASEPLRILLG